MPNYIYFGEQMSIRKTRKYIFLVLTFLIANLSAQENGIYNIMQSGAIGDGKYLNTKIIQKAIDNCSIKGGKVLIPPGKFLTGSLNLKSNVTIELLKGAIILGSTNLTDYEEHIPQLQSYNDVFLKHSLFYAEGIENISIVGEGIIDGQGASFVRTTKEKPQRYMNRPYVIRFVECKNVRLEGIQMQNSAMWMQQYLACEYLTIRGIKVYNHANYNNDMMDIDGCKNVIISDCFGDTDDDGITLKSTSDRITENVTITNCIISSHCNAIKLGTESIGGFRNITISNIVVKPSESKTKIYGEHAGISGITLGMVDGGILDGVMINNIRIDGPQVPIYLRLGNRARTIKEGMDKPNVGSFQNVSISNVIATNTGQFGCSITGIPNHPIKNVSLSNISFVFKGSITEKIKMGVPELEDHYPESNKFGILPSYGFYIRHVEGLSLDNLQFTLEQKDLRYALMFDDVNKLSMKNISLDYNYSENAAVYLDKVKNAVIEKPIIYEGNKIYFESKQLDESVLLED
jgi:polygalacturonase